MVTVEECGDGWLLDLGDRERYVDANGKLCYYSNNEEWEYEGVVYFTSLEDAWKAAMQRQRDAFLADLELAVSNLEEVRAKLLAECQEHGAEFTKEQEAKWEGGFMMLRGILGDELRPMLRAWKEGAQSSRKGEQIMGNEKA